MSVTVGAYEPGAAPEPVLVPGAGPRPAARGRRMARGGPADILYVLCLVQVAFGLLAALGEELLMGGNPLYLLVPLAKAVLLLVLATKAVSGRRWALITLIVLSTLTLVAFWIQLAVAVFPAVGLTVNLTGLATNVALPATVIVLCGQLLRRRPA